MLELHHGEPNGYHLKPLILLKEKNALYRGCWFDPASFSQDRAPWAGETEVAFNLEREGPVLVDDGRPISDALFINLYLDETQAGPQLRPATPEGHWSLLMWGRFVGEVLAPTIHSLGCAAYPPKADPAAVEALPDLERKRGWQAALGAEPEAVLADSRRKAGVAIAKIEAALDPGPWLLGADYSLVDIEVFGHALCLPDLVPELANAEASPRLLAWLERVRARPAVHAALASGRSAKPEQAFVPGPEHSRWG